MNTASPTNVPGEWRVTTWGEEISLEYGKAIRDYATDRGAYRVFGTNGPVGWTESFLAPGPGVILGRKGAYRGVKFSAEPFWVIDTAYYVKPKSDLDMRWLYYAIQHHKLGEIDDGSPIPSTTRSAVYVKPLEVPPLVEQKRIAHILGTLDDKIELNRRMAATLEEMARALFKSWFVDFDPVRAKAEGRPTGLPPDIDALFPDAFEDSELGKIPKGWEVGGVAKLADITSGKRPTAKFPDPLPEAIVPLWGGNGPMAYVADPLFTEPILLTGRVGTLGSVFRICEPCWPSDNTLVIRPSDLSAFEYLFLHLSLIDFASLNRGSTQPLLTQSDLKAQKLAIPTSAVMDCFSRITGSMYRRIDQAALETRTIAALRDALLPKLISGELSVSEVGR
jgi:type I restriction enzyme S subunit